ncbi:23950_t:CDS:2, partial [Gigaspora rosea]
MSEKNYDFFLRIGVDGKRGVGKSCFIAKYAKDDIKNSEYNNALHAYVTTTHIRLNNHAIKVEFLETGWNLRPNQKSNGLHGIKELAYEYSKNKIPMMIIANKCDKNNNKNRDTLLNEVKKYFGKELNILGEKFLFEKTSADEKTIYKLNKLLE